MTGLDWNRLAADDVLGFGVSILTMLLIIGVIVWFACSIVESIAKTGWWITRSDYDALLRENERLKGLLVDVQEENDYLRKIYRDLPSRAEDRGRNAA